MKNVILKVSAIGAVLAGLATSAFAVDPTPTVYPADATASQLLVNGVSSIQTTLFAIAGLIWPYAIAVGLFFLVIRFGMSWFHRK